MSYWGTMIYRQAALIQSRVKEINKKPELSQKVRCFHHATELIKEESVSQKSMWSSHLSQHWLCAIPQTMTRNSPKQKKLELSLSGCLSKTTFFNQKSATYQRKSYWREWNQKFHLKVAVGWMMDMRFLVWLCKALSVDIITWAQTFSSCHSRRQILRNMLRYLLWLVNIIGF